MQRMNQINFIMTGYTWSRELGGKIKECCLCTDEGLIEENKKRYCAEHYSLKIWKKQLHNVDKYLTKKEEDEQREFNNEEKDEF